MKHLKTETKQQIDWGRSKVRWHSFERYHVYERLGFDYGNRVITPAIQESVKQVTARFDAELEIRL